MFYNWHRDYNPALGRYTESDPMGLGAGINTYGYVGAAPLMFVDPEGLQSPLQCANPANVAACVEAGIIEAPKPLPTPTPSVGAGDVAVGAAGAAALAGLDHAVGGRSRPVNGPHDTKGPAYPPAAAADAPACMASSQSEKKRCEKVREECTDKCVKYLGTGDWKFSNCRNVCIKDAG